MASITETSRSIKPMRSPMRKLRKLPVGTVGFSIVLWLLVVVMITPLVWAVISSLETYGEVNSYPPAIIPHTVTGNNYYRLLTVFPFTTFFRNSMSVAVATSLITVLLGAAAAYSVTRRRSLAADVTSFVGLAAYMLPGILIIVPVFGVAYRLHALDSLPALVVIYVAFFVPFGMWQLRSYFSGLPPDLEEAAMVDGASRLEAFFMVVMPQALPGLIATGIWTFTQAWNEYLFASVLLYTTTHQTLSVGLFTAMISDTNLYSWGVLMAACTLMTVPVMIIFIFIQRNLVSGLSSGAIKG